MLPCCQQFLFENRLKDFANDRHEAGGSEFVRGFLRLGLLLRGANLQGLGQFGVKG